ncbi:hypothetical protein F210042A8_17000 [Blautia parvula]
MGGALRWYPANLLPVTKFIAWGSSLSVWGRWIWVPLRETPPTGIPFPLPLPPRLPWGWLWYG